MFKAQRIVWNSALISAKRITSSNWKSETQPSTEEWLVSLSSSVAYEKLKYKLHNRLNILEVARSCMIYTGRNQGSNSF